MNYFMSNEIHFCISQVMPCPEHWIVKVNIQGKLRGKGPYKRYCSSSFPTTSGDGITAALTDFLLGKGLDYSKQREGHSSCLNSSWERQYQVQFNATVQPDAGYVKTAGACSYDV